MTVLQALLQALSKIFDKPQAISIPNTDVVAVVPETKPEPIEPPPSMTLPNLVLSNRPNLGGKPFRYRIGADEQEGKDGEITHVGFNQPLARLGYSTAYCNLFNEKFSEQTAEQRAYYGPYRSDSDTAEEYGEGEIDPDGPGWLRNLTEQFKLRQEQGFDYVELDNPDAYSWVIIEAAIRLAATYSLGVIAKNPGLFADYADRVRYVRHSNVYGIIVEKGAGDPREMDQLRRDAGKKMLPVWFVFFDKHSSNGLGRNAFKRCLGLILKYTNMRATYSPNGEYVAALEING